MTFRLTRRLRLDVAWHKPRGFLLGVIGPTIPFAPIQHIVSLHCGVFLLSLWLETAFPAGATTP